MIDFSKIKSKKEVGKCYSDTILSIAMWGTDIGGISGKTLLM